MFNSNIGLIWAPFRDIMLQNLDDLDFNLPRSLKVKFGSAIGLTIYDFLLMFNSNIERNSTRLQDIRLQILVTLTLTFQGHSRSNVYWGI